MKVTTKRVVMAGAIATAAGVAGLGIATRHAELPAPALPLAHPLLFVIHPRDGGLPQPSPTPEVVVP